MSILYPVVMLTVTGKSKMVQDRVFQKEKTRPIDKVLAKIVPTEVVKILKNKLQ